MVELGKAFRISSLSDLSNFMEETAKLNCVLKFLFSANLKPPFSTSMVFGCGESEASASAIDLG